MPLARILALSTLFLLAACPADEPEPCAPACEDRQCGDDGCGGSCGECEGGASCEEGVCVGPQPTCYDGVQNGEEIDIDCGGTACPKCQPGMKCRGPGDCLTATCIYGICVSATCQDRVYNGTETDVDCGGPQCPACASGRACNGPTDCLSGVCRNQMCVDCAATEHVCLAECVSSDSPLTCGERCDPCTTPANGVATCVNRACGFSCNASFHPCGLQCVQDSPQNCGPACQPCAAPSANGAATCVNNTCGISCNSGYSLCSGECYDLRSDEQNCGSCGRVCSAVKTCQQSICTCPAGSEFNAGTAVDNVRGIEDVAVADFDLDGHLDLATGTWRGVTVLRGNGDGTFRAPLETGTGDPTCLRMITADLDANGRPDLICISNQDVLGVWLGDGDGTFTLGTQLQQDRTGPLAAGDFDGDGHLDIAVGRSRAIRVLYGDGAGGFDATFRDVGMTRDPGYLLAADLDGDGRDDLVTTTFDIGWVYIATQGRNFADYLLLSQDVYGLKDLKAGDFNDDGKIDLAIAGYSYDELAVFLGQGRGFFQAPRTYPSTGAEPTHLAVADFDTDGFEDVVLVNANRNGGGTASMSYYRGRPDGTFYAARDYATNDHPLQVAAGDFDENGAPDVAVVDSYGSTMDLWMGACFP